MTTIEQSITCRSPGAAVDALAVETGLSRTRIKRAMTCGAVWINRAGKAQRLRRAKADLRVGDQVSLYYDEAILAAEPAPPDLIMDRAAYSVWHKPAGLLSSGTRWGDHCSINRLVERQLDRPAFLVHRLDRFAWGVMVLAHTRAAAAHLSAQFQARTVEKTYKAVIHGHLDGPRRIEAALDGREAITLIEPIDGNDLASLVEVRILTGRKHQIRRHLATVGLPILGDRQYGERPSGPDDQLMLASVRLAFDCPVSEARVTFDLPAAFHPRWSVQSTTAD